MSETGEKLRALALATLAVTAATFALASFAGPAAAANAPDVSNPMLSETGNDEVRFTFDTDEQLGTSASDVTVTVDGPNTDDVYALDRNDFTELPLGGGIYRYEAKTSRKYDDGEGTYNATIDDAKDGSGNNGGNNGDGSNLYSTYTYTSATVVNSGIGVKSGPGSASNLQVQASYSFGLLQIDVTDSGGNYELSDDGFTKESLLNVSVVVSNDTPRALIGNARDAGWERTSNPNGTTTLVIEGKPSETDYYFPTPNTWPGDLTATDHRDLSMSLATASMDRMSGERRSRMDGIIFMTDAQSFGPPTYNTSGENDAIDFDVAATHFNKSGRVNHGFAEVFLPDAMLTHWGVAASDVTGKYEGEDRETTITEVSGGALAKMEIHYSQGTAQYTVDSGSGGSGGTSLSYPSAGGDRQAGEDTATATPTPTATATPTATPAATPTDAPTATATPTSTAADRPATADTAVQPATDDETSGSNGPGFGPPVAVIALLAAALVARRRR